MKVDVQYCTPEQIATLVECGLLVAVDDELKPKDKDE